MPPTRPVTPYVRAASFDCPSCGAFAQQSWFVASWNAQDSVESAQPRGAISGVCTACGESSVWRERSFVGGDFNVRFEWMLTWPLTADSRGPLPAESPDAVKELWDEARQVAPTSSRSAAALLRLALQTLLAELVPGVTDLNTAIGRALSGGVPEPVQQSMDILRIGGNSAVHPAGELRLDDDPADLDALFQLLSFVVQETVVRPAMIASMYSRIPQAKRDAIDRRDSRSADQSGSGDGSPQA